MDLNDPWLQKESL